MPDDDGLSVYRTDLLVSSGCAPVDVAAASERPCVVAGIADADVQAVALQIQLDPMTEPELIGPAHALLVGWTGSKKAIRGTARKLARSAIPVCPEGEWGNF